MTKFWKTMADVTGEKLQELGALGTVLGILWILGIWLLFDAMMEAYAEHVPTAGQMFGLLLVAWIIIGLAIYLWQDPHEVRDEYLG